MKCKIKFQIKLLDLRRVITNEVKNGSWCVAMSDIKRIGECIGPKQAQLSTKHSHDFQIK